MDCLIFTSSFTGSTAAPLPGNTLILKNLGDTDLVNFLGFWLQRLGWTNINAFSTECAVAEMKIQNRRPGLQPTIFQDGQGNNVGRTDFQTFIAFQAKRFKPLLILASWRTEQMRPPGGRLGYASQQKKASRCAQTLQKISSRYPRQ
jgi:hypothetical protein